MAFDDTPKIALIEDDDIVRQATSQWLQLAGFDVTAFSLGEEGKAAILSKNLMRLSVMFACQTPMVCRY